jgi:malonate decarboxylase epsilon subunit
MSLAFLVPGQGSQQPDLLHTLPSSPAVSAVLGESGSRLRDLDLDAGTTDVQIALLIAGVACARALTEEYRLSPQFVAGHSVGTFSAAVIAGVITLAEALAAVALSGRLMEEACAEGDWGMAAVSGLPIRVISLQDSGVEGAVRRANRLLEG